MTGIETKENILNRLYKNGKKILKTKTGKVLVGITAAGVLGGSTYLLSQSQSDEKAEANNNKIENVKPKQQEQTVFRLKKSITIFSELNTEFQNDFRSLIKNGAFKLKVVSQDGKYFDETHIIDFDDKEESYGTAQIYNKKNELIGQVDFMNERRVIKESVNAVKTADNHIKETIHKEHSEPIFYVGGQLTILDKTNKELKDFVNAHKEDFQEETISELRDNHMNWLRDCHDLRARAEGWEESLLGRTIEQFKQQQTKTKQLLVKNQLSNVK